jgi:multifunctional methyltransferase subunit TRM112
MKLLTLNFLTCARKACKPNPESFPLQPRDCTLEILETDFNPQFLCNMLPRLEWPALVTMTTELGLTGLKAERPERGDLVVTAAAGDKEVVEGGDGEEEEEVGTQLARDLHRLLMETTVQEGKLVCRACGHEYAVKEGIANFLLPSHLV